MGVFFFSAGVLHLVVCVFSTLFASRTSLTSLPHSCTIPAFPCKRRFLPADSSLFFALPPFSFDLRRATFFDSSALFGGAGSRGVRVQLASTFLLSALLRCFAPFSSIAFPSF
jgi:hypothetical protein